MRKIKTIIKICYFYLVVGFFNLGVSSGYVFLRDGRIDPRLIEPKLTIFFWPVSSFSSAKALFGKEGAQVWHYFSVAGIFLFVALMIFLVKEDIKK